MGLTTPRPDYENVDFAVRLPVDSHIHRYEPSLTVGTLDESKTKGIGNGE